MSEARKSVLGGGPEDLGPPYTHATISTPRSILNPPGDETEWRERLASGHVPCPLCTRTSAEWRAAERLARLVLDTDANWQVRPGREDRVPMPWSEMKAEARKVLGEK